MSSPPLDACEASADSAGADASADADSEAACEGDSDAAAQPRRQRIQMRTVNCHYHAEQFGLFFIFNSLLVFFGALNMTMRFSLFALPA